MNSIRSSGVPITPAPVWFSSSAGCSSLPSGSRIAVSYDWHALNAEGEAEIAAITPEGFAAEIEQWRVLVLAAQG